MSDYRPDFLGKTPMKFSDKEQKMLNKITYNNAFASKACRRLGYDNINMLFPSLEYSKTEEYKKAWEDIRPLAKQLKEEYESKSKITP